MKYKRYLSTFIIIYRASIVGLLSAGAGVNVAGVHMQPKPSLHICRDHPTLEIQRPLVSTRMQRLTRLCMHYPRLCIIHIQ